MKRHSYYVTAFLLLNAATLFGMKARIINTSNQEVNVALYTVGKDRQDEFVTSVSPDPWYSYFPDSPTAEVVDLGNNALGALKLDANPIVRFKQAGISTDATFEVKGLYGHLQIQRVISDEEAQKEQEESAAAVKKLKDESLKSSLQKSPLQKSTLPAPW